MNAVLGFGQALLGAIPRIIQLIKQGRDVGSIKLEEVISQDALDKLTAAKKEAEDFIRDG